jgi:serine/threonine-protein kinase
VLAAAAPDDPLLGVIIDGRYRIEQRIGDGGMGVVYRAMHVALNKPFAVKVLRADQAHDSELVMRFLQEARAASAIGHPNIVNISDFGTMTDGDAYLVMEFLVGRTLAETMGSGPLEYGRALDIFVQIAGALDAAHERGIVHRDLKPENIFLKREPDNPDFVKVLDFGIAKVRNAASKITRTGMVFGTPHYMSPEQAAGQPVDHRSDIYSLGVIMYQVLSGQLPFDAESIMQIMTKHMYEPPPSPRQLGIALPSVLERLLMQMLQKKPEDRPQTMRELQQLLQDIQASPGSEPSPEPAPVVHATGPTSVAPVAFVRSETLLQAAEHDVVRDEVSAAVPKVRRPMWIWVVALCVAMAIALLTLIGPGSREQSTQPPATDTTAPPSADLEPAQPPAAPASGPTDPPPSAAPSPAPAPAPAAEPERPNAARPEHAAKTSQAKHPAATKTASGPAKPTATEHGNSRPAASRKPAAPSESADPWR